MDQARRSIGPAVRFLDKRAFPRLCANHVYHVLIVLEQRHVQVPARQRERSFFPPRVGFHEIAQLDPFQVKEERIYVRQLPSGTHLAERKRQKRQRDPRDP